MDPITNVTGYIDSRTVSSVVGRKGDLRVTTLVVPEGPFGMLRAGGGEEVDGVDDFCSRCERRGVPAGESILTVI